MSAELYSVSAPDGNDASVQGTRVGGSKPLHRFIKGQPKTIGAVVLILGNSFFILSIALGGDFSGHSLLIMMNNGFSLGALLLICGILYIVTDHYPTKKTVTISLALSIVTILAVFWSLLHILPEIASVPFYRFSSYYEENGTEFEMLWANNYENMGISLEMVFLFYNFAAAIILIVMSSMAGRALRSTKTQAIVVMKTAAPETPTE